MPAITIKKADGTFETVPLDQLKKKQNPVAASTDLVKKNSSPAANLPQVVSPNLPARIPSRSAKPSIQVKSAARDFSSPLEEVVDAPRVALDPHQSFADTHVEHVLKTISFSVPQDYENRLRTIVQLVMKHVRTEDQTREVLMRPVDQGGLGLGARRSDELLAICTEELKKMHPEFAVELPATTTPFNPFKHAEKNKIEQRGVASVPSALASGSQNSPQEELRNNTERILRSPAMARVSMQDVVHRPVALGPIDEIKAMTLTDVRRLAPIAKDAFARFGQKLVNVKNESILFFFEARDAYYRGSLFSDYTTFLIQALQEHAALETVLTRSGTWTQEEVGELVKIEQSIGM